jgi:hypothetical protein
MGRAYQKTREKNHASSAILFDKNAESQPKPEQG